jgi:hypothetical protein
MTNSSSATPATNQKDAKTKLAPASTSAEPQPSYVKLAMRNMVRKGSTSLQHFALTTIGLLTLIIGLAYITR